MKILLVEDEPKVSAFIRKGLEEEHYEVDVAYDGYYGTQLALRGGYDLIIMDVILPRMSGVEAVQAIRKQDSGTPVLMLTALGATDDKLAGFDAGVDDYLLKPFDFKELLARIRALTRRLSRETKGSVLELADLTLDTAAKQVTRGGQAIRLTAREFALLEFLLRNKGRVMSRVEIAEHSWDESFDFSSNVIDVYVSYLRNKIDKNFTPRLIHTVVGMGYVMRVEG